MFTNENFHFCYIELRDKSSTTKETEMETQINWKIESKMTNSWDGKIFKFSILKKQIKIQSIELLTMPQNPWLDFSVQFSSFALYKYDF